MIIRSEGLGNPGAVSHVALAAAGAALLLCTGAFLNPGAAEALPYLGE